MGDRIGLLRQIKQQISAISNSVPEEYRLSLYVAYVSIQDSIIEIYDGFMDGEITPNEWEHKYTGEPKQ